VLTLTAPVGTLVTYDTVQTTRTTVVRVNVEPRPNVRLTAEALEKYRAQFSTAGGTPAAKPVEVTYLQYLRVLPRAADGSDVLQYSADITVGDAVQKLRYRQTIGRDGRFRTEVLAGTSPLMRTVVEGVDAAGLTGANPVLYGKPTVAGQSVTTTGRVDVGRFVGRAVPGLTIDGDLVYSATVTYGGRRPDGTRQVEVRTTMDPATVTFDVGGGRQTMTFAETTSTSTMVYRADGLPARTEYRTDGRLTIVMDLPDLPVLVTTELRQEQSLRQTAR